MWFKLPHPMHTHTGLTSLRSMGYRSGPNFRDRIRSGTILPRSLRSAQPEAVRVHFDRIVTSDRCRVARCIAMLILLPPHRMALLFDFHAKVGDTAQPHDMWEWYSPELRAAPDASSRL